MTVQNNKNEIKEQKNKKNYSKPYIIQREEITQKCSLKHLNDNLGLFVIPLDVLSYNDFSEFKFLEIKCNLSDGCFFEPPQRNTIILETSKLSNSIILSWRIKFSKDLAKTIWPISIQYSGLTIKPSNASQ
ncbi:MAG: hypothetical protein ACXAC7_05170 [Candidatus Hodarchaeales archaeon]|jgi:hypothetical protein